jgi:arginyl-tRNA synthetase
MIQGQQLRLSLDRMTSYEGDTGPYLQYAHARLSSITRKAELSLEDLLHADFSLSSNPMPSILRGC